MMKSVIFDLDGTLVDSMDAIAASINHVRAVLYGLPPMSTQDVAETLLNALPHAPRILYGTPRYEPRAKEIFERHYTSEGLKKVRLFEGIKPLINDLYSEGFELFVATNGPGASAEALLKKEGLRDRFCRILGADCNVKPKPDPEMVLRLKKAAAYSEVVMVGDSANDFLAAEGAGIEAIAAAWSPHYRPHPASKGLIAVRSPEALKRVLKGKSL